MFKKIFNKRNIILFLLSSGITLVLQIIAFLDLETIDPTTVKFWTIIGITNGLGFVISLMIEKIYNLIIDDK